MSVSIVYACRIGFHHLYYDVVDDMLADIKSLHTHASGPITSATIREWEDIPLPVLEFCYDNNIGIIHKNAGLYDITYYDKEKLGIVIANRILSTQCTTFSGGVNI